jgi:hypothetical protein
MSKCQNLREYLSKNPHSKTRVYKGLVHFFQRLANEHLYHPRLGPENIFVDIHQYDLVDTEEKARPIHLEKYHFCVNNIYQFSRFSPHDEYYSLNHLLKNYYDSVYCHPQLILQRTFTTQEEECILLYTLLKILIIDFDLKLTMQTINLENIIF